MTLNMLFDQWVCCFVFGFFFFFKQKTAYEMSVSDWSSDVCSSDLGRPRFEVHAGAASRHPGVSGDPAEPLQRFEARGSPQGSGTGREAAAHPGAPRSAGARRG